MKDFQKIPKPGDRIKVISAGYGAMGCDRKVGFVRGREEVVTNGLTDEKEGFYFTPDGTKEVWRLPFETEFRFLCKGARIKPQEGKSSNSITLDVSNKKAALASLKKLEELIERQYPKCPEPVDWTEEELSSLTAYCSNAARRMEELDYWFPELTPERTTLMIFNRKNGNGKVLTARCDDTDYPNVKVGRALCIAKYFGDNAILSIIQRKNAGCAKRGE